MVNYEFISLSAVQIYDLSYIHLQSQCSRDLNLEISKRDQVDEPVSSTLISPEDWPQSKSLNSITRPQVKLFTFH